MIGPTDSGSSVVVGSLLEVAGIPVISHSATSNELSSPQYRHFFRTAPPESQQASAIVDIIEHFTWSYVAAVAMDDSYGRSGVWGLETKAEKRKTFCIAFAEYIPRKEYSSKLIRTVTKIKSYANVKVVVLWLFGSYGRRFLIEAVKHKLDDRTWILSDGLSTEDEVFAGLNNTDHKIIHGSLGVQPRHLENLYFENFLIGEATNSSKNNRVPWWEEFWRNQNRDFFNCSLTQRSKNRTSCQEMLLRATYNTYIPYVVDAVSAVAHALHHMINCSVSKRTIPEEECPDLLPSVDPQEVERFLRTVDFQGLTGKVRFDSFGDPVSSSYDIVHFKPSNTLSQDRHTVKIVIGSWEKGRNPQMKLNDKNIKWNAQTKQTTTPKSFCHENCSQGTFQSLTTPCCWECIKCPAGTVSTGINSVNCTDCPEGQKPNERRSNCLDLPEVEMMWSSLTAVLVIILATVGFLVVIVCSAILYQYRNTPLIKAANRELSCILMITIALSFSVSILTLAKPTNFTCSLDVAWRSAVLVTSVSVLILKTMKILSAFRINVIAERLKKFILAAKWQTWLVLTLISPQVSFVLLWITLDPPRQERIVQSVEGTIALSCSLYQSPVGRTFQITIIVYLSFLAIVCTIYAFKARTLPENFNEARYIAFSMYILLLSCVGYFPVHIGPKGPTSTNLTCAMTLLSSYGLLACMFGPKMYVILRQPEQNTPEAVCSQVSEYSFSSSIKGRVAVAPVISDATVSLGDVHQ